MKVEFRNREILEAETSIKEFSKLELCQKAAYANSKNARIIGNEAQDLRFAIQMNKEKYEASSLFREKLQIILEDDTVPADARSKAIADLEAQYPGARFAIDDHNRMTAETLRQTQELDLWEIKYEWLPEKLASSSLGPLVALVTDGDKAE